MGQAGAHIGCGATETGILLFHTSQLLNLSHNRILLAEGTLTRHLCTLEDPANIRQVTEQCNHLHKGQRAGAAASEAHRLQLLHGCAVILKLPPRKHGCHVHLGLYWPITHDKGSCWPPLCRVQYCVPVDEALLCLQESLIACLRWANAALEHLGVGGHGVVLHVRPRLSR